MRHYFRKTAYKESPYALDLVKIMKAGAGPWTRKMLAEALSKKHPDLTWQELMIEVSYAIQQDRWSKKNRFKVAKHSWYELADKKNPSR